MYSRPGFLARLGPLIIIQSLFIFMAVVLVVFEDGGDWSQESNLFRLSSSLESSVKQARSLINDDNPGGHDSLVASLDAELDRLDQVLFADLYFIDKDGNSQAKYSFVKLNSNLDLTGPFEIYESLVHQSMVDSKLSGPIPEVTPVLFSSAHAVGFHRFEIEEEHQALLVTFQTHDFLISKRSSLKHGLLIIFLVSSLLTLLTVHLITDRFKDPFKRLVEGFQKTAKGELHRIVEPIGDSELVQLTEAFNEMSNGLWKTRNSLRVSNSKLQDSNNDLISSQNFLEALIDNSPICVISATDDGRIVTFNKAATEAFGYSKTEAMGMQAEELFVNSSRRRDIHDPNQEIEGVELLGRKQDGTIFPAFLIHTTLDPNQDQNEVELFIVRDISESKNFQEMILKLDRYYTRGEMATDIAHEINNYVAVISGSLELLPMFLKNDDKLKIDEKCRIMRETIDKIGKFSAGLLDHNEDNIVFEPADLNQVAQNIVTFLKPQNRLNHLNISTHLSTDLPLVQIDKTQIQQLLVSLIYNSADAVRGQMGDRKIEVRTSMIVENKIRMAIIEVIDNGPGIDPDSIPGLFVKRFTSKDGGNGFGLISCRRIVDGHNGTIHYDRLGNNTVFKIQLPIRRQVPIINNSSEQVPASAPFA